MTAVQNFQKVLGTRCAAFESKVTKGEGNMIEWRLSLNGPDTVLIVWIVGRKQRRGYSVGRAGEDVAATGLSEASSEPPALSRRARLKSHEEAVPCRDDGVTQLLSSTHTDKAGGRRA